MATVTIAPTRPRDDLASFRSNREGMLELLVGLDEQLRLARDGGDEKYVARHRERGKLLARESVELLLDRDSAFLELAPLEPGLRAEFAGCAAQPRSSATVSASSSRASASGPSLPR